MLPLPPICHHEVGTVARRYTLAATKKLSEGLRSVPQRISHKNRPRRNDLDREDRLGRQEVTSQRRKHEEVAAQQEHLMKEEENSWNGPRSTWKESAPQLADHLNFVFPELHFPPEVAKRILTHGSHPSAIYGHNGALSFMGRRVMESFLLLMLHSSSALKKDHNLDEIVARTLNSYTLGEVVGSKWALGRAMRWTPSISASLLKAEADQREMLRSVGLYKVQGEAVNAVVGGVFFQFGASVAHRLFHTRVLPLLIDHGLPLAFSEDARVACKRLGGEDGKLLLLDPLTLEQVAETAS
ncbi:hypothetical protein E4T56_gene10305 [Termitomyces sp. T112]|nr:hypothetical protein E4T56_gene10305 [Termitomyces sp. T112]